MRGLLPLFLSCLLAVSVLADTKQSLKQDLSITSLISENSHVKAGTSFWVAFNIKPKKGWHTYWENPGDSGAKPILEWTLPKGIKAAAPVFQAPNRINTGPLMTYGYEGENSLLVKFTVDADYPNKTIPIKLSAEWLICDIECIPEFGDFAIEISIGNQSTKSTDQSIFDTARSHQAEESWWDTEISISKETGVLKVFMDIDEVKSIKDVYFFPEQEGVLVYANQQTVAKLDDGIALAFTRNAGSVVPQIVSGVLEINNEDGTKVHFNIVPALTIQSAPNPIDTKDAIVPTFPLWQALFFAFMGGILLNLMPCVFPVLSLKAFAMISCGSMSKTERRREGWAYTAGILASFMTIVAVLVALRSGGTALGWGFQLQEPRFVGFMVIMLTLVAMSLAGIFHIQTGLEGTGQGLTQQKGSKGAFFTGVLATLVATPCTVPLMAPAIGFALTQSTAVIFATFFMLGFGLAAPFLLLTYSDTIASRMPRPGPWMDKVKQGLAFPMIMTAFWLASVYGEQTGGSLALMMVVSSIAFLVWLREQYSGLIIRRIILLVTIACIGYFTFTPKDIIEKSAVQTNGVEIFSKVKLQEYRNQGKPVFVYYTADWCITCKLNERVALKRDATESLFEKYNVVMLKSDETAGFSKETHEVLKKYGRAGIPLYLYYPKDGSEAKLLPSIITIDIIRKYIEG